MKISIFRRMLLGILAPTVLSLAAISFLGYMASRDMMKSQIDEEMQLVANGLRNALASDIQTVNDALDNFSTLQRVSAPLLAKPGSPEELKRIRDMASLAARDLARTFALISGAGVVDAKGTVLAHTKADFIGTDMADRAYIQRALAGERAAMTVVSRATKEITTAIAIPVKDNGRVIGAVYCTTNLDSIARQNVNKVKIARDGMAFVYDQDGMMIMHQDKNNLGNQDSQNPVMRPIATATAGGRYIYDWNGSPRLAYFEKVPFTNWTVVVRADLSDVLSPVAAMARNSAIIVLTAMVIVGGIITIMARRFSFCLRGMSGIVRKVAAGQLDLDEREQCILGDNCSRGDEIGILSQGVQSMIEDLKQLMKDSALKTAEAEKAAENAHQIAQEAEGLRTAAENARREGMHEAADHLARSVEIISTASTQLSAQVAQSERGASQQASRVADTATAMEQMNSTVVEVAKSAGAAADASSHTREKAEQGAGVVRKAVQSILDVQQESLELKAVMATLSQQAQGINQIMRVISDIADQTNLLALNAAIEAARAGDAGRGFAVVADEVRKLAEKTMASTTDVDKAIRSIQQSAATSMNQVDAAVKTIEEAALFANESGSALVEIVTLADGTADKVRSIATSSEEQSASSEQISHSIQEVNTIASETSDNMRHALKVVAELAAQAHHLQQLVNQMKAA